MNSNNSNAAAEAGLVARLLGTDSTLGIIAGLTALASHQENNNFDLLDGADDDSLGGPLSSSDERNTTKKKKNKPSSTATATATGENSGSSQSAASAKKYSVHEQRDAIRKLKERNQIMKQELSIEFRDAKQLVANDKKLKMDYLHQMTKSFAHKMDTTKKQITKLDDQIFKKEHELEKLRQQQYHGGTSGTTSEPAASGGQSSAESSGSGGAAGASGGGGETTAAITRRVRSLENRLELTLVKKNEMDSITKHLRSQIEKVRKDRVIFDGIYKKLEKELSDFQTRFDASCEELRKANEAKANVTKEIHQIQVKAEKEQKQYEQQFHELRLQIECAMRAVQEATTTTTSQGSGGGALACGILASPSGPELSQEREIWKKGVVASSPTISGAPGRAPEPVATTAATGASPLKRLTAVSSWKIGFDRALATSSDHIVTKYDQVFHGIKQLTGIQDITKIAQAITQKDDENFKRFKHVEELQNEEEALKVQIEQLTLAIEEFKAKEGIATGVTQKQQYRMLELKYKTVLAKNKAFDVDYEETTNKLTRVKSSIHSIHSMLVHANCAKNADQFTSVVHGSGSSGSGSGSGGSGSNSGTGNGSSSVAAAFGTHSARDITDTNVLEYLQAIELFTSSLMKENHEASVSAAAAGVGAVAGAGGATGASPLASPGARTRSSSSSHGHHVHETASSPIGHGPSTLSSDPAQKLRVQVPSFGGLNGVIILPAATPSQSLGGGPQGGVGAGGGHNKSISPLASLQQQQQQQQQQQRKKTGRFELSSRRSLSQQQFAAALAAATSTPSSPPSAPSTASSLASTVSLLDASSSWPSTSHATERPPVVPPLQAEEDEEERAYTYDELRDFAAKHLIKKRDDPAAAAVRGHTAGGGGGGGGRAHPSPPKSRV